VAIDQQPIGRMPRSNAATYSDAFTPIREAFAATAHAREGGLTARHFSFNVPGGRCDRCQGAGVLSVQMHFLPDVQVRCPACGGRRFKPEVLAVRYGGHDIAGVLDMTVEEALALLAGVPAAAARLQLMADVGLGYPQLGQPATTLSGGETQRIKLAKELGRRATGRTLYLLDEPTTGLHAADTAAAGRAPAAGRRRQQRGQHRARPARHPRVRLGGRPRPRGRRRRRRTRGREHARAGRAGAASRTGAFLRDRDLR
jgi:excinuclease ABC subunit A